MTENIVLDREITEKSKSTACKIDNSDLRKRAYALNIAANAVENYLSSKGFSVNTEHCLRNLPTFAQSLELADIYVNNTRLDVRVTFDEKIFYIPKIQDKYDATPVAYIITKLDSSLDNIQILGFIESQNLEKQKIANEYYCYESSILKPISELNSYLKNTDSRKYVPAPEEIDKMKELAIAFIDNNLSESEKVYFIKNVIKYSLCREILCDLNNFDKVANQISNYTELINDSTLSILSGNEQEIGEAILANLATVENAEENQELLISEDEEELIVANEAEEAVSAAEEIEDLTLETVEDTEALETADNTESIVLPEVEHEELTLEEYNENSSIEDNIEEEEIIKPMSVLSLEKEENSPENDMISENLLDIENNNIETENLEDLNIVEDFVAQDFEHEELTLVEEDSTSEIMAQEIETEEFSAPVLELEEHNTELNDEIHNEISKIPHEELLLEEDSDNLLLNEVADLLEAKEDSEQIDSSNEVENRTGFVFELEEENTVEKQPVEVENLTEETTVNSIEVAEAIETAETAEEAETVNSVQAPEKEGHFDEFDLSELDNLTDSAIDEAQNENNSNIQNLLDDDLKAILSDKDTEAENTVADEDVQTSPIAFNQPIENQAEPTNSIHKAQAPNTIETLFEENAQTAAQENTSFELAQEPVSESTMKNVKNTIVGIALLLALIGGGAITWFMNHKPAQDNSIDTSNQDNELFDLKNNAVAPEDETPAVAQDINKSMTNSFSDKPAAITITKLSWQVSEKLAAENSVKEYLQTAGKNIQINLQNDLANSADINFNNSIKISFEIAPDNTMKGMQILESSGSDQVDEIVQRSIKNTLKYVSVPKLNNFNSDFFLTLIINF